MIRVGQGRTKKMDCKRIVLAVSLGAALAYPACSQTITTAAANTMLGSATGVALDAAGNIYIADSYSSGVYKVDRLGQITKLAGTGKAGYSGDGGLSSSAQVYGPTSVAVDSTGVVYIAEYDGQRIRKIDKNGIITTYAGTGRGGLTGEGGPAVSAQVYYPYHLEVDSSDNLWVAERGNYRIRKIDHQTGIIKTVIGTGKRGDAGDGGPALLADIDPGCFKVLADGTVYFTNDGAGSAGGDGLRTVRKMAPDQTISRVAGNGKAGFSGDGGPATAASMYHPLGVAVDGTGNVFIADFANDRVRKVAPSGIITTYAGTGSGGAGGDGGPATSGQINGPADLTLDGAGNLYIADYYNHRVRKVAPLAGPSISATNSGVPSFQGKAGFSSNSYLEIYGTNLSQTTRTWSGSDFNGSNAPTSLDGVSVTVNDKPAFVYYISPTQININTPEDTATGNVLIQVKNSAGLSNVGSVTRAAVSPTLQTIAQFAIGGKQYVVAQTPDFSAFIGNPGMLTGLNFVTAKPGDTVIIYALGCGPTNPATHAGQVTAQNSDLASPYEVQIGRVPAKVSFAGMLANTIGLYQLNIVIPDVPAGDQPIELAVNGVSNAQNLVIAVGQ
jgi:uncharacterized protein (TIGR03437 family)